MIETEILVVVLTAGSLFYEKRIVKHWVNARKKVIETQKFGCKK